MPDKNHISLATSDRQLVLIFNSDVKKTKVAGTVWTEIADLLDLRVLDIIKTDHATFIEKYGKDHKVDCDGAIKFLQKDPVMLIYPIVIKGDKAKEVQIYGHMQDFFGPDTAAVNIP